MCALSEALDKMEESIKVGSMLNLFQYGMALKVLEDKLWGIDDSLAQRCNNLQHKILGE